MKKFKLLAFVALALVAVMALSSCGTVKNFNKIFNEEYDLTEDPYKTAEKISDLKDYEAVGGNEYFVVFNKADSDGNVTTAIYSFVSNSIVKRVESDKDIVYSVSFVDNNLPICVVTSTTIPQMPEFDEMIEGDFEPEEPVVTKMYYDATGKQLLSVEAEAESGEPRALYGSDLVIINAAVYKVNKDKGAVEFSKDIPAYVSTDGLYGAYGEYFYSISGKTVKIYNADFAPVALWTAPSYAEEMESFIFNNGDVLAQYRVTLAEDAVFYDFIEDGVKYDLVSKIITAKGKVKNVNLDYVVLNLAPNCFYYDAESDNNEFTDDFDNFAVIAKIDNKRIDNTEMNRDVVLMSNSGAIQKSCKIVDGQTTELPEKIAADLFMVDTSYGYAMVNAKGEVQFQITNTDIQVYGEYIIATNAIYNLSFTKIYDLGENDAEIIAKFNDTIFVKAGEEDEYSILSFGNGGNQRTVFTYDDEEETHFELVSGIGYVIIERNEKKDTVEYEYFAVNGASLMSTEAPVNLVANGEDCVIVSVTEDEQTNFYVIKK